MRERIGRIEKCRISQSMNLVSVLSLGNQALTGVFPRSVESQVTVGPLELVWCPDSGLLQLAHYYDASEMYGDNYGYRSGLNQSMVRHLTQKIHQLEKYAQLQPGEVVVDIGSNDATSLKAYQTPGLRRIGIDPTGRRFAQFYSDDIVLVPDF
ncbi:MAG: methyltransferase, partial [Acidobacteria bacterium]|nr:methyltransferase [Acidobacteriota bacterium]